ncbi:ABC transporter substrate-binding protein [Tabrizicola sp.]|jgi:iron complex transport system substrate-binding protein|uniref:ABC transporter substrate-binding protein n=1 Tax=Tabrizicola sp. TaxID=2005166 RepID=UPI0025D48FA4|nr:ABC transporter substrate-binding protein [Tabrizicola sp.]MBY0349643.1 ABC transporter substrate-binding protein [Tabrizicola sp.]
MKTALLAVFALSSPALAFPVTVQSCNRQVTFDAAPARAIANDVNLIEMMLALGLRDRMVGYTGVSGWKTLDPELREGIAELPELSAKYPSREVLLGAEPDFFFAGWNYGMTVGGEVTPETLDPLGIKTYELTESCIFVGPKSRSTMQDMYADLLNLGTIFGVDERAKALVAGYEAQLAAITASIDRSRPLRVFVYDSGEETPFTAGAYAIPTALIEAAGGRNIMEDLEKSWATVAWEPVVERNPEVIVIVNYGDVTADQKIAFLEANSAFAKVDAVKNDRYVVLEYVEATPGPRNIRAVEKLVAGFWGK